MKKRRRSRSRRRSLHELSRFCLGRADALSDLAHRMRSACEEARGPKASCDTLSVAIERLSEAVCELLSALPPSRAGGSTAARAVCAGLIANWLAGEPSGAGKPAMSGRCDSLPMSTMLELLHTQRKSGTLSVKGKDEDFTLVLVDGDLEQASSSNPPVGQRLGDLLVARQDLDRALVDRLIDAYARTTMPIGEILMRESAICQEVLRDALEQQMTNLVRRLLQAEGATFEFVEREGTDPREKVRLSLRRLMFEASRSRDESAGLRSD